MSAVRKTASMVSSKEQSYSWRYQRSPRARRSLSRNAGVIRGHCVAGMRMRFQRPGPCHSLWNQPRRPKGVDNATRRPPETADGLEPYQNSPCFPQVQPDGGAESGAMAKDSAADDPGLAFLAERWAELSPSVRQAILFLASTCRVPVSAAFRGGSVIDSAACVGMTSRSSLRLCQGHPTPIPIIAPSPLPLGVRGFA